MRITASDWVMNVGRFYSAPFTSRFFLFRLYDLDCSFLIYHEKNSRFERREIRADRTSAPVPTGAGDAPGSCAVHWADSSRLTLPELAQRPPQTMSLTGLSEQACQCGPLTVAISLRDLAWSKVHTVFRPQGDQPVYEYEYGDEGLWLRSPAPLVQVGANPVHAGNPAGVAGPFFWNVAVSDAAGQRLCVTADGSWSIEAIQADEQWNEEICLWLGRPSGRLRRRA